MTRICSVVGALVLIPLGVAKAETSRWGGTIYPARASSPMPASAPIPLIGALVPAVEAPRPMSRRAARRMRRLEMQAAATAPIETTPAPSPAEFKTRESEPNRTEGPHEAPAPTIQALVTKHARENGIPENLASAVVRIESRFNPNARGGSALGLMQIKVQTARAAGFAGDARSLMAPDTNLHFGMKVLADAYKSSGGNVCLALAKYQSGHLTTHLSAANRAYCARARTFMARA